MKLGLLNAQSDELLHLDLLRILASVGIVFHHSHEFFYSPQTRMEATSTTQGLALFVDLFFLISGFVIAHVYFHRIDSAASYKTFMMRRVFRLVPLHWVTLGCSIAIWSVLTQFGNASSGPTFSAACIASTSLLLNAIYKCGSAFNGQSWSISAEMVAYAFFPLLTFLSIKSKAFPFLVWAAGLIATVAAAPISLNDFRWDLINPIVRVLISFSLGVGLWTIKEYLKLPQPRILIWVAFVALCMTMMLDAPQMITLGLVYIVGMFAVACDVDSSPPNLIVKKFAPLGQLTYSLYMWHGIFILTIMNVIGDKIFHIHGVTAVLLGIFTYISLGIFSYLSLEYIEAPTRLYLERLVRHRRGKQRAK